MCMLCIRAKQFAQAGSLDTTFAVAGKFTLSDNNNIKGAAATIIQPDGKIIFCAHGQSLIGGSKTDDFAIVRLNTNGTLDSSFNNNGIVYVDFSTPDFYSSDQAYSLALQSNGKIIVSGYANVAHYDSNTGIYNAFDFAVARINANGSLDSSFDGDGKN